MKRNLIFNLSLVAIIIASSSFIYKKGFVHMISSPGIIGKTGSPGESTCAQCHGGGSGISSVGVSASPAFVSNQYVTGQTYTITITVSNPSFTFFGFNAEILNSSNTNAGTVTSALTGVQLADFGARRNATHTGAKGGSGSASFSFVWVAPLSGQATIYAGGNSIDANSSTSGDSPGSTSLVLTAAPLSVYAESKEIVGFNVYPNPVISDFKINYTLVNSGDVKIAVYDLQGKEMATLLNEKQSEGYHSLQTGLPESLAKGVYFVKLVAGEKAPVQRLIVIQ